MARIVIILVIIAMISLGLSRMADEPGKVIIYWSNYHIETSLLFLISAVAIVALLCSIFYSLIYLLIHTPRSWMRSYLARRQAMGLQALTDAFAAIATQDLPVARKRLKHAQHYLPNQPLNLMLSAQLARLEGNEGNARLYMEQMLGNEVTKFMALRNLIENARKSNDTDLAISHCKQALAIKPQDNWVIATLAELYAKGGQAEAAIHLLDASLKKRYISREFHRRESAYVLYESAKSLAENGRVHHAVAALRESVKKLPDFIPASALLAEMHMAENNLKEAIKAVARAWKISPHLQLRGILLRILQKYENRKKFLPSVQKITKLRPEHEESRMLAKDLNEMY
jgi:HemY protein